MARQSEATKLAVMANDIDHIKNKVDAIVKKMDEDYVTHAELEAKLAPHILVRNVVFGLVGLVLVTVFGALLTYVIISNGV